MQSVIPSVSKACFKRRFRTCTLMFLMFDTFVRTTLAASHFNRAKIANPLPDQLPVLTSNNNKKKSLLISLLTMDLAKRTLCSVINWERGTDLFLYQMHSCTLCL